MSGISTEKKATNFVKLLRQHGETVKSVTIDGKKITVQLADSDELTFNELDFIDFKK